MNNTDSSYGQTEIDQMVSEYKIEIQENVVVNIQEYDVVNYEVNRYMAEFEYMDAQYKLIGLMEKEEFDEIIKNLIFL